MPFAHGALFLLRTPLAALLHISPANVFSQSAWLEVLSMEALLFTISIAFILLAMAKERMEYRHRAAARTDLGASAAPRGRSAARRHSPAAPRRGARAS